MVESFDYDAVIVGVGGMGSAATYHLADRGADVLGLERYDIPHDRGSSFGHSRTIGRMFYRTEAYLDLYDRTYELWEKLEDRSGSRLFSKTGSLLSGEPGTDPVTGARRTYERFDIPHETLTPAEANERFPGYDIPDTHTVLYQPTDGFIRPTAALLTHVEMAHAAGAELHAREAVTSWEPLESGVRVKTDKSVYTAKSLVLTAGPWLSEFLDSFGVAATVERRLIARFQPAQPAQFCPDALPVSSINTGRGHFGAFPIQGVPGVKIAGSSESMEQTDPDNVDEPTLRDEAPLRRFAERYLSEGAGPTMQLKTCLYTNTPDGDLIVDTHPEFPQVSFAGGFSGHGYKFTPLMGEILADFVLDGETNHHVEPFGIDRF